jgi:hypothetical protein
MNDIEKMTGMTDKEAEYWDDYFTKNPPTVNPSKNRLTEQGLLPILVDKASAEYFGTQAKLHNKTVPEFVADMVRREMAYA